MERGTCGKNLTWTLDDGTLTISGTTIGEDAFKHCENLTSVIIPAGVISVAKNVFYCCNALEKIYYPAGADFADKLRAGNDAELIPY